MRRSALNKKIGSTQDAPSVCVCVCVYIYLPAQALHYHLAQPRAWKKHQSRHRRHNVHRQPHQPATHIYIYIYIYGVCVLFTAIPTNLQYVHKSADIHAFMLTHTHTHIHMMCVCVCVCLSVCLSVFVYLKQALKSRGLAECSRHTFKK
jgi:hypothetical protein